MCIASHYFLNRYLSYLLQWSIANTKTKQIYLFKFSLKVGLNLG